MVSLINNITLEELHSEVAPQTVNNKAHLCVFEGI